MQSQHCEHGEAAHADLVMPAGPNKGRKMGLNENYAREIMELHTLGVDGGYTQQDVIEVARAFTGWTIERPREKGTFRFQAAAHDQGAKKVLGHVLPGYGGEQDGIHVIDILARHPATARFIATKLARRFVSDEPPPALVERVAQTFRDEFGIPHPISGYGMTEIPGVTCSPFGGPAKPGT